MAVKITASGKVDKRTREGKAICAPMSKARAARRKAKTSGRTTSSLKRTLSGRVDKRTKEGKEICARMAKARRAKNSLSNRIKRLLK